jgi:membrane-bound ClpP family serine protease
MTFDLIIVAALIILGVLFMLIEIFLLPGISIAGIAGAIFLIGGIAYAYLFLGSTAGNVTLAAAAVALGGMFVWMLRSKTLRRISLDTSIESTIDNTNLQKMAVGDTGIAVSRLNPIGKVMVHDIVTEGKSVDGEFIEEDSEIEVVKIDTYHVLVRRKENGVHPATPEKVAGQEPVNLQPGKKAAEQEPVMGGSEIPSEHATPEKVTGQEPVNLQPGEKAPEQKPG